MKDPTKGLYPDLNVHGTLTVHLISGEGLLSADSNGLSDPYVKVRVLHYKDETQVPPPRTSPYLRTPPHAYP